MTLKEVKEELKKELKELLKDKKKKDDLIKKLIKRFEDKELKKEFKDKVPENYVDDTLQGEEFVPIRNGKYFASNSGRIKFHDGKVIPQCQDEDWNWKLDKEKFNNENIAGETKVYDFMKETSWLENEYKEIIDIYGKDCYSKECVLELHHINRWGDNRIDNMIYLPACIHREVHSNIKK